MDSRSEDLDELPRTSLRVRRFTLAVLLLVHLVWGSCGVSPGPLLIDEAIYHLMADRFVAAGDLVVPNGHPVSSAELVLTHTRQVEDGIAPQYPPVAAVLAAAFYTILGFRGLFVLNLVAFFLVVLLLYRLTILLFEEERLGYDAALLFVAGTFAWEYAHAAWPQMCGLAFIMGSLVLAVESWRRGGQTIFLLSSGLLLGLGIGIRLDVLFVLPALLFPALVTRCWRTSVLIIVGMTPGLVGLSLANTYKFGEWSPLTYGSVGGTTTSGVIHYLPVAALGLVAILLLWAALRYWDDRPDLVWLGALAAGLIALMAPPLVDLRSGLYSLLIDLRAYPLENVGPALERGPNGEMIYWRGLKKSLLQSIPWLVLCLPPIVKALRSRTRLSEHAFLLLWASAYIGVYSWFQWHGGLAVQLRYFIPVLPVVAIIGAHGLHMVAVRSSDSRGRTRPRLLLSVVAASTATALFAFEGFGTPDFEMAKFLVYDFPILIAALLAALIGLSLVRPISGSTWLQSATCGAAAAAIMWSASVSVLYDYQWSQWIRIRNLIQADTFAVHVENSSVIICDLIDPVPKMLDDLDDLVIVYPFNDQGKDLRRVVNELGGRDLYITSGEQNAGWILGQLGDALKSYEVKAESNGRMLLSVEVIEPIER